MSGLNDVKVSSYIVSSIIMDGYLDSIGFHRCVERGKDTYTEYNIHNTECRLYLLLGSTFSTTHSPYFIYNDNSYVYILSFRVHSSDRLLVQNFFSTCRLIYLFNTQTSDIYSFLFIFVKLSNVIMEFSFQFLLIPDVNFGIYVFWGLLDHNLCILYKRQIPHVNMLFYT